MKTFKDIYKFPLKKEYSRVTDKTGAFVFQFEPKFKNGDYSEGWLELEDRILVRLNGTENKNLEGTTFIHEAGKIYAVQGDKKMHVITIKAWGYLTGTGGLHLSSKEACNIQDTFADFIIVKLNQQTHENQNYSI